MPDFRVGATTGLYSIGRAPEISTPVRKTGYVLTRGVDVMEIALDLAHEVIYTDGAEVRHIAKKQGLDITVHGDLNVPIGRPERNDWRDAFDRMTKSVRSAVFMGAIYIDFHASFDQWLELLTFTTQKQAFAYVDHEGRFISEILYENERLRKWFVEKLGMQLPRDILTNDDEKEMNNIKQERLQSKIKEINNAKGQLINIQNQINDQAAKFREAEAKGDRERLAAIEKKIQSLSDAGQSLKQREADLETEMESIKQSTNEIMRDVILRKLASKDPKKRKWDNEDIRGAGVTVLDGHFIMAHYLFYRQDPIWIEMAKQYPEVMKKYRLDYNNFDWIDNTWREEETKNEKDFKEFFYAVVTAKYLEGMIKKTLDWIENTLIKKEIPEFSKNADDPAAEQKELTEIAKKILFAIENPEARSVEHAGMHLLWRPKQIYAAVKTIRRTLNTDRVWIIVDHEHIATQGLDALLESRDIRKNIQDFGEYTISVHSNHPNPLHLHDPIDHGDNLLYELLYNLRATGFGKKRECFLIFERGGGREQGDPFERSIDALKVIGRLLEKDVKPADLPLEFYGLEGMAGDETRQMMKILENKMNPIKDLLELPEEEWGLLSRQAREKGKAEAFKKEEFK